MTPYFHTKVHSEKKHENEENEIAIAIIGKTTDQTPLQTTFNVFFFVVAKIYARTVYRKTKIALKNSAKKSFYTIGGEKLACNSITRDHFTLNHNYKNPHIISIGNF